MSAKAFEFDGLDRDIKMASSESAKPRSPLLDKRNLVMAGISGIAIVVGIFAADIYLALKYLR
jgi:hypothetical protein